jgi:hypothetical protein
MENIGIFRTSEKDILVPWLSTHNWRKLMNLRGAMRSN